MNRWILLGCLTGLTLGALADTREIDVSIAVFDPGLEQADPSQYNKLGIFPEIRKLEARYLPFALRYTLEKTDQWGPIRVVPNADLKSELLITGKILQSDGINFEVLIVATDSSGREWLNQYYIDVASDSDYQSNSVAKQRPFQALYDRISDDLLSAASSLSASQLQSIDSIALLRYAESLSPDAFSGYLEHTTAGYTLRRLPALDDPMLGRVKRVREQEYLFIDTVDGQYAKLFQELGPTYDLWRQFNREQAIYERLKKKSLANRSEPRRGSYDAIKQSYSNFKWAKVQEQESARLAEGFSNETKPTFLNVQNRVVELSGSLEDQYRDWRRILKDIFALETGAEH